LEKPDRIKLWLRKKECRVNKNANLIDNENKTSTETIVRRKKMKLSLC
jgi:hypothetical protein